MSASKKISSSWIAIFVILSLIENAYSKLRIERPDPLVTVFKDTNGEIESQYANFGHIPYGQTLVSQIRFWLLILNFGSIDR